jgi:biopolymer transport protein ExbB
MDIVSVLLDVTLLGSVWVLWLLLLLSVLSISIIIERTIYFSKTRLDFGAFSHELTKYLDEKNSQAIRGLCEKSEALECRVALKALESEKRGPDALQESTLGFLLSEKSHLDRGLVVLGTLGNNAPFIGLFGTVLGIIQAFNQLSVNPAGGPSVVMAGISEALIATAVGLVVAIPAVIAFNGFQRVIKKRLSNAEAVIKMMVAYQR